MKFPGVPGVLHEFEGSPLELSWNSTGTPQNAWSFPESSRNAQRFPYSPGTRGASLELPRNSELSTCSRGFQGSSRRDPRIAWEFR